MLLRETCDGEVGFAAMVEYSEDLDSEGDGSDFQCYFETGSVILRGANGASSHKGYDLTVLLCHPSPDPRSISINYNVLNAILSPLLEYPGNLLPCFGFRGLKAHHRHGRLDAQESCKPVLVLLLYNSGSLRCGFAFLLPLIVAVALTCHAGCTHLLQCTSHICMMDVRGSCGGDYACRVVKIVT